MQRLIHCQRWLSALVYFLPLITYSPVTMASGLNNENLCAFHLKGKIGFIDQHGKVVVNPIYEAGGEFNEGYAAVKTNNGRWVYIGNNGEIASPKQYDKAGRFSEGYAVVTDHNGSWPEPYIIDKRWNKISERTIFRLLPHVAEGLIGYQDGKWGFMTPTGITAIEPKYDAVFPFGKSGLAQVQLDGKFGFINRNGDEVGGIIYDEVENAPANDLAWVKANGKYGFIDTKSGSFILDPIYRKARGFSNELAAIQDENNLWGYVNRSGLIINPTFTNARSFNRAGLAIVTLKDGEEWVIDAKGNKLRIAIKPDSFKENCSNGVTKKFSSLDDYFSGEGLQLIDNKGKSIASFDKWKAATLRQNEEDLKRKADYDQSLLGCNNNYTVNIISRYYSNTVWRMESSPHSQLMGDIMCHKFDKNKNGEDVCVDFTAYPGGAPGREGAKSKILTFNYESFNSLSEAVKYIYKSRCSALHK